METVEVTIISGKDLKNVNWRHGKLKPYAVAWVDPTTKVSTPVDDEGDTSPFWNHKLIVPFSSPVENSTLHIDIVHAGATEDTKPLVGSAELPLRDGGGERTLQLKRPSGRPQGKLEITVNIPERRYRAPDAYYAPPYGSVYRPESRDYPAPPSGYPAYGAPPSGYPAYGAPPSGYPAYGAPAYGGPPSGYGYVEEEEKKKSKFGGMGTGLAVGAVAGVLGGLALAEGVDALEDHIADEAAERVEDDVGYDDDGGDDY